MLEGCAVTANGWVQSYGSRCVKPPIIFGDVMRTRPMTVEWASTRSRCTDRPVKGMLTGPITILQWSFVRNDQPLRDHGPAAGLAIRDEVADLEAAGIEGDPDRRARTPRGPAPRDRATARTTWTGRSVRSDWRPRGWRDETQIHTHMCYGEFGDIIESIAAFDADVISIEASRSQMELLGAFAEFEYPNEIGPGIWDIHSPRVPDVDEMAELLRAALQVIPAERLWVNPDCGLKTRRWEEVGPALTNMVGAAERVRRDLTTT